MTNRRMPRLDYMMIDRRQNCQPKPAHPLYAEFDDWSPTELPAQTGALTMRQIWWFIANRTVRPSRRTHYMWNLMICRWRNCQPKPTHSSYAEFDDLSLIELPAQARPTLAICRIQWLIANRSASPKLIQFGCYCKDLMIATVNVSNHLITLFGQRPQRANVL